MKYKTPLRSRFPMTTTQMPIEFAELLVLSKERAAEFPISYASCH